MPNQHVVPNNGQWAVRPEGGSRVTTRTNTRPKQFVSPAKSRAIKVASSSFMDVMAEFVNVIVTGATRFPQGRPIQGHP